MKSIKRDYKDMLIAILIMGIVSMTIAYANFTRRLMIVNNGEVNATNWDIHFENLVLRPSSGNDNAVIVSPARIEENKTVISGLKIELTKPGDYVKYTFDIVNAGEIDAKLSSANISTPICEDNHDICKFIHYTIKYTDGSQIKVADELKVGQRRNATMIIKLDDAVTNMPNKKINVTGLDAIFDYVQD